MSKSKNLGEFEILVLAALIRLGDDAYGVTIRQEIESRAGRDVSIGALYTTLQRLEEKDLVASRMGDATPERGGRAKRYFELTTKGRAHFERSIASLGAMLKGFETVAQNAPHTHLSPPRAAAAILRTVARGGAMAALIGDLDEEYAARAHESRDGAARWYWRQTALSAAHLIIAEARRPALRNTVLGLGLAFLLLQAWNLWVAPGAAQQFYLWTEGGSYTPARIVYFTVAVIGAGAAGAVFARFAPPSPGGARQFLTRRAGPAALLIFAPAVFEIVMAGANYPVLYRFAQTGLAAAAFIAGAGLYAARMRRRP